MIFLKINFKKIYTTIIIISPIIIVYYIGFPSLTLNIVLLIPILLILLFYSKGIFRIEFWILPFLVYIILNFIFIAINMDNNQMESVIFRTGKYIIYLICLLLYTKKYFDFDFGCYIYKIIAIISAVFLIIQYIGVKLFQFYILGFVKLPFVKVSDVMYIYLDVVTTGRRLPGLFTEPSLFCRFVLGALIICLFEKTKKYNLIGAIIISLGILLSVSSTGILVATGIWGIKLINMSLKKSNGHPILLMLFIMPILLIFLSKMPTFQLFIERMLEGKSTGMRLQGFTVFFEENIIIRLLGHSMLDTAEIYLAGFYRMIYYFGWIGLLIFLFSILYCIKGKKSIQKLFIFIFLILNIGTEIALSVEILLYLSFAIAICEEERISTNEYEKGSNDYTLLR